MLGDEKKYDAYVQQQEAQKQRMMDERAGQQCLPVEMPKFVDGMTDDEKKLSSKLAACAIMVILESEMRGNVMGIMDKWERELILLHRAIVAKAVSDAAQHLPKAGNPFPAAGSF